jgi:hypothetical protein
MPNLEACEAFALTYKTLPSLIIKVARSWGNYSSMAMSGSIIYRGSSCSWGSSTRRCSSPSGLSIGAAVQTSLNSLYVLDVRRCTAAVVRELLEGLVIVVIRRHSELLYVER